MSGLIRAFTAAITASSLAMNWVGISTEVCMRNASLENVVVANKTRRAGGGPYFAAHFAKAKKAGKATKGILRFHLLFHWLEGLLVDEWR